MQRIYVSFLAIALCALLMSPAPTAAQSTVDKITSATVKEKDAAVAHGKKLVSDMDGQIKQLEGQIREGHQRGQGRLAAPAERAEGQARGDRQEARQDGKATEQNWDITKKGFADVFKDLEGSFAKVAANIKK